MVVRETMRDRCREGWLSILDRVLGRDKACLMVMIKSTKVNLEGVGVDGANLHPNQLTASDPFLDLGLCN